MNSPNAMPPSTDPVEEAAYCAAEKEGDEAAWCRFLAEWPEGWHAGRARAMLLDLWLGESSLANAELTAGELAGDAGALVLPGGIRIDLRWCPPGEFMMGEVEMTGVVPVRITQGYWMGKFTVTQAQWEAVMGWNRSRFPDPHQPVETVNWFEAKEFVERVQTLASLPAGWLVALPTEAQWEYACRAGTTTDYFWGNECNGQECNCDGTQPHRTKSTGHRGVKPQRGGCHGENPWGICDMHGNVWEWCEDFHADPLPGGVDPTGPPIGPGHVNRGGAWDSDAASCRSGTRCPEIADSTLDNLGFRIAVVRNRRNTVT